MRCGIGKFFCDLLFVANLKQSTNWWESDIIGKAKTINNRNKRSKTSSNQPTGQNQFECIQLLFVIYLSLVVICYHLLATSSNQPVDQNQFECSQQWQRSAGCNLRSSPSNGIVNKMVIIIINHDYRHHRGHDPVYYDDYDSSHDNDDDLDSSTCVSQAQEAIADPEAPIAWVWRHLNIWVWRHLVRFPDPLLNWKFADIPLTGQREKIGGKWGQYIGEESSLKTTWWNNPVASCESIRWPAEAAPAESPNRVTLSLIVYVVNEIV